MKGVFPIQDFSTTLTDAIPLYTIPFVGQPAKLLILLQIREGKKLYNSSILVASRNVLWLMVAATPLTHNMTTLVIEVSSTGSAALKLAVKLLLGCAR